MTHDFKVLAKFHEICLDYIEHQLTNEGKQMYLEIGLILYALEERNGSRIITERKD